MAPNTDCSGSKRATWPTKPKNESSTLDMPSPCHSETVASENGLVNSQETNSYLNDAEWVLSRQQALIIFALAVNSIVVSLDATIIVTSLTNIANDLHSTAVESFWIGTSYLLVFAVIQPFIASLSEIIGQQGALLTSLLFFLTGTVVCSMSHKVVDLLVGRAIQGIGGGGLTVMSNVLLTSIVPLRQRPKYVGYIQACWALGTVIGPIVGGLFAQYATWRWVFYINFPFIVLGFVMIPISMHNFEHGKERAAFSSVDWLGGLICTSGITMLLVSLTIGGHEYAWTSREVLVPIAVGLVSVLLAMLWETFGTTKVFLHTYLFRTRSGAATYIIAVGQGIVLYGEMYYISLYLQGVKLLSPVQTGSVLLAISLGLMPTSIVFGRLITRSGKYRWALWIGCLWNVMSNGLLMLLNPQSSQVLYISLLVLIGLGQGILFSSLQFSAQAAVEKHDQGRSAAMYTFMRSLGMALGVALGGAVFQNILQEKTKHLKLDPGLARDITAYIFAARSQGASHLREVLIEALSEALRDVFLLLTCVSAFAFGLSLLIKHHSMDR